MKIIVCVFVFMMSFNLANAQEVAEFLMNTNKADYNGWKLKKGVKLPLSNGDTGIIKEMSWYAHMGNNLLYVTMEDKSGTTSVVDFEKWVYDDKIILPNGILKKEPSKPLIADGVTIDGDTSISGYELFRGLKLAGKELSTYYRMQTTGLTLTILGSAATATGLVLSANNVDGAAYVAAGGAAISLIGWIVSSSSHKRIGVAGSYLQGIIPINIGKKKASYL